MSKYPPVLLVFFLVSGATSLVALPMDGPTVDACRDNMPLRDSPQKISLGEDNQNWTREVGSSKQEQSRGTSLSLSEEKSIIGSATDASDNPFTFPATDVNRDSMELPSLSRDEHPLGAIINHSSSSTTSSRTPESHLPAHFNGIKCEDITDFTNGTAPARLQRSLTFPSYFSRNRTSSTWPHVEKAAADITNKEGLSHSVLKDESYGFEIIDDETSPYAWENIAEKSLQNENLNENFSLSDLETPSSEPLKKIGLLGKLNLLVNSRLSSSRPQKEELLLKNLKGIFKKSLKECYQKKFNRMVDEIGINPNSIEYNDLCKGAERDLAAITTRLEATLEDPAVPSSHAVQEAHKNMIISLYSLREYATAFTSRFPQFCKTESGEWSVIQPAPKIENLVLPGGGMKGVGFKGVLTALQQAGLLKHLKHLAGSSAGAITAALLASGMDAMEVEEASNEINFKKALIGSSTDPVIQASSNYYQGGCYDFHSMGFDGNYLKEEVNDKITRSIKNYFELLGTAALEEKIEASSLEPEEQSDLLALQKIIAPSLTATSATSSETTHLVTFKELALLRKIDPRFKNLTVTAFNVNDQNTIYHNAQTAPDLPIAEAVTISAALPGAYKARADKVTGDTLVDGGVGSNIPSEVFSNEEKAKTLVLGFDNNGRFNDIVHQNADSAPINPQSIEAQFSGNNNFAERTRRDREKLKAAGPNAFPVKHGKLGTISFTASEKRLTAAQNQAEIHAWEQLALRQNQGVYTIFPTLEAAMQEMSDQEIEDIAISYALTPGRKETLSAEDRSEISRLAQAEITKRNSI